jgi:RNA polymerase sigma factor (sigma-70 family)
MGNGQWTGVVRQIQRLFQGGSVAGLTEGQLLDRFLTTRDEIAFGALVTRHGPMVLGVCRGVLNDPNDVEDAFQATFLILVKKAKALRDRDRLAPWLYGVARRVSLRARADSARRRAKEQSINIDPGDQEETLDAELRELQAAIREEVDRLSNHDRMAVVLCYLEGFTHEEAADRLGWPVGTVKGRLSRAREKLKERLTRRGISLPTLFAITSGRSAPTLISTSLLRSTTLAATQLASGQTLTAGIISAHAISLMERVIGTMFMSSLKFGATAVVASCFLAIPAVLTVQGPATSSKSADAPKSTPISPLKNDVESPPVDPKAADLAGAQDVSAQFAAQAIELLDDLKAKGMTVDDASYATWSRRLVDATLALKGPKPARLKILRDHLKRMEGIYQRVSGLVKKGQAAKLDGLEAAYQLNEAYWHVLEAEADEKPSKAVKTAGGGGFGESSEVHREPLILKPSPGDEQRNEAILSMLELPIPLKFQADTPLEDVKKYIQDATQDGAIKGRAGFPNGLTIYVDPDGLQAADKTMASTVSIDLEGIPLRTTLHLLLRQLYLDYQVTGGLILISDEDSIQFAEAIEKKRKVAK